MLCEKPSSVVPSLGRLLPVPRRVDCWIHSGCLLWARDVVVRKDVISGIPAVLQRAQVSVCHQCRSFGASLHCRVRGCLAAYHLPCAIKLGVTLLAGKPPGFVCRDHAAVDASQFAASEAAADQPEQQHQVPGDYAVGTRRALCLVVGEEEERAAAAPSQQKQQQRSYHVELTWEDRLQQFIAKNPSTFLNQQYEARDRELEVRCVPTHC